MLACRLCRVPIDAPSGCAVCDPVRNNLIAVGETDDEKPSLAGTGSEVVAGIRGQLAQIRGELKADPGNLQAETRLLRLGNTAAKVLEAARKLQNDGVDAVNAMSFAERAELFLQWFTSLPPPYRRDLTEKIAEWEAERAQPIPESARAN